MQAYFQNLQQFALKLESNTISDVVYDFMIIFVHVMYGGSTRTLKSDRILKNVEKHFPIHDVSFQITRALSRLANTNGDYQLFTTST